MSQAQPLGNPSSNPNKRTSSEQSNNLNYQWKSLYDNTIQQMNVAPNEYRSCSSDSNIVQNHYLKDSGSQKVLDWQISEEPTLKNISRSDSAYKPIVGSIEDKLVPLHQQFSGRISQENFRWQPTNHEDVKGKAENGSVSSTYMNMFLGNKYPGGYKQTDDKLYGSTPSSVATLDYCNSPKQKDICGASLGGMSIGSIREELYFLTQFQNNQVLPTDSNYQMIGSDNVQGFTDSFQMQNCANEQ